MLFLSLGPVQFFLFEQFFRTLPPEVIEAATVDGAGEARSCSASCCRWRTRRGHGGDHHLPAELGAVVPGADHLGDARHLHAAGGAAALNGELGTNFQGIMALALITTLPPALVFLLAQRRVMGGLTEGAVKG